MPPEVRPEDLERWKHKYYDSLAETERMEKVLAAVEALLYRSLGRLALTGYGAHPDLDKGLDRLREALRAHCSHAEVEKLVERVGAIAERHPAGDRAAAVPTVDPKQALLSLIEALGEQPGCKALRKRVEASGDAAQAAGLVATWLSAQLDQQPVADESTGCISLLDHLAGSINGAPDCRETLKQLLRGHRDPISQRAAFELVEKTAAALDDQLSRGTPPSTSELHVALLALVRGLSGLFDDDAGLRSLEQTLANQEGFQQQVVALAEIANLVVSLHQRLKAERAGIENFLATLTERLHDLEEFVDTAHADHQASEAAGVELGDEVHSQVESLHAEARQAVDLDQLRRSLDQRLSTIGQRVSRHLEAERERHLEAREQLTRLDQRLRETEAEAGRLRRVLDEERARASQDSLTGVANRGAFDKRLLEEVSRSRRSGRPLALMFLDVDHFKRFNDDYGHQTGDRVLSHVAKLLRDSLRAHDFPARYGGEEFVALMPDTDAAQALTVAERVRNSVAAAGFKFRGQPVQVTLSAGVAELLDEEDADALVARADAALYAAKHAGRNRCVSAAA